jgi:hypothetical protein
LYAQPDCSLASATWALAALTSAAFIAAVSAYLLEVEPQLVFHAVKTFTDDDLRRAFVDIYIAEDAGNRFLLLIGQRAADARLKSYRVSFGRFANVGRSPLVGFSALLEVTRTRTVRRARLVDVPSGASRMVPEYHRERREVRLGHLTAKEDDAQREVCVAVYLDPALLEDTHVRWTGDAVAGQRRFWYTRPEPLRFPRRPLDLPASRA